MEYRALLRLAEEFSIKLGQRIKELRKQKGMSLKQFEVMEGGFDRAMLSRIENGKEAVTVYTLYRICEVLNLKLSDVVNI